jgi:hypothetical protein
VVPTSDADDTVIADELLLDLGGSDLFGVAVGVVAGGAHTTP